MLNDVFVNNSILSRPLFISRSSKTCQSEKPCPDIRDETSNDEMSLQASQANQLGSSQCIRGSSTQFR
jgi:hypothetical protein